MVVSKSLPPLGSQFPHLWIELSDFHKPANFKVIALDFKCVRLGKKTQRKLLVSFKVQDIPLSRGWGARSHHVKGRSEGSSGQGSTPAAGCDEQLRDGVQKKVGAGQKLRMSSQERVVEGSLRV